ncbi:uncharacterized protein [Dermacentor albipictus]|uniref:uncharacterized protein isoform X2 n=1 Tax=Dermacentor albipictus TaxID=60249 RepID=UPI0031FD20DB
MGAWPGRPRSKRVPCRHRNPSTMFSTHWLHSNIACADRLHSVTRSTAVCKTAIYRTHRFTWLQEQRGDQRPQRHPHVKPHVPVARNILSSVLTGSGRDEDLPTTHFERQILRSEATCSETAEEPLTQAAEVQLQRQVANLLQGGQIYRDDDERGRLDHC